MEIKSTVEKDGKLLRLEIIGRLETTTTSQLHQAASGINPASYEQVLVDGRDLEYLSSSGLREILFLAQKCNGVCQFKVINLNEVCMDVFHTTGFDTIMDISKAETDLSTYTGLSFKALLAQKAEQFPNTIVLEMEDESYTWSDIEKIGQIIAADLTSMGAGKGSHVAIYGANSVNWVFTFFAVQKIGGIAVLLNPNLRAEEIVLHSHLGDIEYLCYGDSQPLDSDAIMKIVGEDSKIRKLYDIRSSRHFTERLSEYPALQGKFIQTVMADDPAVMIFSSGSTGRPKGVLLSAYNILNAGLVNSRDLQITDKDSICMILPLFHIFGLVAGLFGNSMNNSRIVIPKNAHSETILECIEKKHCTLMHAVPTLLLAMLNNKNFSSEKVKSLSRTIISGASATEAQLHMFREKMPNNDFFSSYGLSELAPATITTAHDTVEHLTKTVGKAVKNVELRVCDRESGKVLGVGESGEVELRGFNLMTAYYKMDLKDQSFDPDGWLRTGDMGFLDEEGYLHLTGRFKDLIIRGGENIIPSEIAAVITEYPAVKDAVVVAAPSEFYGEEVAACLLLKDGIPYDQEEMLDLVRSRMAKFKVPSYVFIYEDFPHLPNGKIDMVNLRKDVKTKVEGGMKK